ncbi:hypothetical protein RHMOL_Rhmol06G0188600 [Rhododendron molle]|uniref:Uncharacterized protein n=1 Tax=Rhododendron molle TaxID=49168 RepID=A0ACC0NF95_RHOML|nr:hypothetical protein RHMOL_Rhmol06G0188600 [Rhododendron molle]
MGPTSEELEMLVVLRWFTHETSLRCLSCLSRDFSYITWWVMMDLRRNGDVAVQVGEIVRSQ